MKIQELQSGFALEILDYKPNQEQKTLRKLLLRFGGDLYQGYRVGLS